MNIVTKSYESLLPFLVVEAISAQNLPFHHMSVRMMDQGWAWLVCGRKLLVWKFKEKDPRGPNNSKTRRILSPCFELQLPQSDLIHRAELCHVFFVPSNLNTSTRATTVPAALAISPEGCVRFWSSVANERCTETISNEMQGQEFCTLSPLSHLEYILGTTTGSIFLLTIDIAAHDTKNVLICSPLTTASSLLVGISRRVSNLFFGQMTTDAGAESKRPLIAVPKYSQSTIDASGSSERPFFILSSNCKLRHWSRAGDGPTGVNHLIREWDLQIPIHDKLSGLLGNGINFWPIDMITTKSNELLILIVTHDSTHDNQIRYATCAFNPYQMNDIITSATIMRSYTWRYNNESEEQLLSLRFLERRSTSNVSFLYDRKLLFLINIKEDILDAIDYCNQSDSILGAGIIDGHPILFTQRDGLIYVAPVASNQSRLNETSMQLDHQPSVQNVQNTSVHSRHESLKHSRIEPMIVELDEDDIDSHPETAPDQPSTNPSHSIVDQSSNQSINKTVNQSRKSYDDSIREPSRDTLLHNKEFEWIKFIDERDYGKASETLASLAQDSDLLKDRKETLISLSKIADLAK